MQLLHLRARWYATYLNQFISPDPIIPDYFNPQSLNKYSYAYNNPINHTDPSGNTPECQSQECKIELVSTQIQVDDAPAWVRNLAGNARHLALLFTDRNGVPQFAEGFPSGEPLSLNPGTIIAQISNPNDINELGQVEYQLNEERNGAFGAKFTTLLEGDLACDKWQCITTKMRYIETLEKPYNLITSNSNSMVSTALKACGIFISWSGGINNHFGWNNNLIKPPPILFDPIMCTHYPEMCDQGPIGPI
jgi:hypothetical protein